MSLINDALKRAKKAQQENPPPTPDLQFRPVEPTQGYPRSPFYLVGAVLGLFVIFGLGGLLVWVVAQQRGASLPVEAKTVESSAPVEVAPVPPTAGTTEDLVAPVSSPEEAMTNTLPAAVVEAPPQPEFKLKGIFFNPRRPSAVVNDRTVYVGDRVSGFQVFAITPETVMLGNSTETNVLSLSE